MFTARRYDRLGQQHMAFQVARVVMPTPTCDNNVAPTMIAALDPFFIAMACLATRSPYGARDTHDGFSVEILGALVEVDNVASCTGKAQHI